MLPMTKDSSGGKLQFIYDPMPEKDFEGRGGICFRDRAEGTVVDTLIIHSCYVEDAIIAPLATGQIAEATEDLARALLAEARSAQLRSEQEGSPDQQIQWREWALEQRALAQHVLILARRGSAGLTHYHRQAIKDIFQFHGVSAHYLIDRDGEIFELVSPDRHCFHAGPSRLPLEDDAREAVNDFSIGIELMGTHTSGFTDIQYVSLARLIQTLKARYPIRHIFGHADVALPAGRKSDPWLFDWERLRREME